MGYSDQWCKTKKLVLMQLLSFIVYFLYIKLHDIITVMSFDYLKVYINLVDMIKCLSVYMGWYFQTKPLDDKTFIKEFPVQRLSRAHADLTKYEKGLPNIGFWMLVHSVCSGMGCKINFGTLGFLV